MSLAKATPLGQDALPRLDDEAPYGGDELLPWAGQRFWLPPGDPRLPALHHGGPAPTPPLENLVGAVRAWREHPTWMDYLDESSPIHAEKLTERAFYLDHWERHLPPPGTRVLDVGGGVGRLTSYFLDRGDEVELVDPDLRALWRAVWAAAGRPGLLDVHWTTAEKLPELPPFDVAVASELLCYVEDPEAAVDNLWRALWPQGLLLCSVEARYGWAFAPDVPEGALEAWLGDGVVHIPGDRWVRTFDEAQLRALLEPRFEILEVLPTHYAFSGPFEAVAGPLSVQDALAVERRLRAHPVASGLNRAWSAVARRR